MVACWLLWSLVLELVWAQAEVYGYLLYWGLALLWDPVCGPCCLPGQLWFEP